MTLDALEISRVFKVMTDVKLLECYHLSDQILVSYLLETSAKKKSLRARFHITEALIIIE